MKKMLFNKKVLAGSAISYVIYAALVLFVFFPPFAGASNGAYATGMTELAVMCWLFLAPIGFTMIAVGIIILFRLTKAMYNGEI